MVLFHHVQHSFNKISNFKINTIVGAFGVDVFFIISGFIMVFISQGRNLQPHAFWIDRVIRIVPLYWIATLGFVALSLIGFAPVGLHHWTAADLWTSLFFIPSVRSDGTAAPLIVPGWTLNFEMFFYLVFGLTLLLRDQIRSVFLLSGFFVALWGIGKILAPAHFAARFYLDPITLEFAAGCILALIYTRSRYFTVKHPYIIVAPLLLMAIIILGLGEARYDEKGLFLIPETRLIVFGIPAFLIVTGALILEQSGVRSRNRLALLQGDASYSIYLFHLIFLHLGFKVAERIIPEAFANAAIPITICVIIGVLVGATLIHLFVEKPISKFAKSGFRSQSARTPASLRHP
jgi:exopolysaccharide production protein ExoZ